MHNRTEVHGRIEDEVAETTVPPSSVPSVVTSILNVLQDYAQLWHRRRYTTDTLRVVVVLESTSMDID